MVFHRRCKPFAVKHDKFRGGRRVVSVIRVPFRCYVVDPGAYVRVKTIFHRQFDELPTLSRG